MTTTKLILQRLTPPDRSELGTFGVIMNAFDMVPWCVTLELQWKNNERDISCIPAGEYECSVPKDADMDAVFRVKSVLNRTKITAHVGNYLMNTKGCILLGRAFSIIDGIPGIGYSRAACEMFIQKMGYGAEFTLEVRGI